jgi:hypothetical protein
MLMSARPSKPDAEQQRPGAGVKTSIVSGQLSALHADRTSRISACGTNNAHRPEIDIICGKYCARIGDRDLNVEGRGRRHAIVGGIKKTINIIEQTVRRERCKHLEFISGFYAVTRNSAGLD